MKPEMLSVVNAAGEVVAEVVMDWIDFGPSGTFGYLLPEAASPLYDDGYWVWRGDDWYPMEAEQ